MSRRQFETYKLKPYAKFSPFMKLYVFKTLATMRSTVKKLKGCEDDDQSRTIACVYARHRGKVIDGDPDFVAEIFLNEQNLSMSTICHESLHAALCWDRTVNGFEGDYDSYPSNDEERLATIVGDVARIVVSALYEGRHLVEGRHPKSRK